MLWALLAKNQEVLALEQMGHYHHYLKKELFVYALSNDNTKFMKEALRMQAFEQSMFSDAKVIAAMLSFFTQDGSKTNFILNVLLLTDISVWKT